MNLSPFLSLRLAPYALGRNRTQPARCQIGRRYSPYGTHRCFFPVDTVKEEL